MQSNPEDAIDSENSSQVPRPNIRNRDDETPLHLAAKSNNGNEAKRLLEAGADANALDRFDNTPLHVAVDLKALEVIGALLHHRATNVNAVRGGGQTPLLIAAFGGRQYLPIALALICAGANVNAATASKRMTALHMAAINNCPCLAKVLMIFKGNVNARDRQLRTPLHYATNADIVKSLLDFRADADAQDNEGRTPLHLAVTRGDMLVFRLLLRRTMDVNARAHDGGTPLITAFESGMELAAFDLLNSGAWVRAADHRSVTALHRAAEFRHSNDNLKAIRLRLKAILAKKLLDLGADPNARDDSGNTPLLIALKAGAWPVCQLLLRYISTDLHARNNLNDMTPLMVLLHSSCKIDADVFKYLIHKSVSIHAVDKEGRTALHYAATFNKADELNLLIVHGADVNAVDTAGMTALHKAVESGAWTAFKILLGQKLDWNARTPGGKTPLMLLLAAESFERSNFERLIELGADIHASDNEGQSVLHYAAKFDRHHAVIGLIELGANVHATDKAGMMVLHRAAELGSHAAFEVLLRQKTLDWNARTPDGKTPLMLMLAAESFERSNFERLIELGADIHASDNEGQSVLHYAAKFDRHHAVIGLIELGADVHATDPAGMTVLHRAAESGSWAVLDILLRRKLDWNARTRDGKTPLMLMFQPKPVYVGYYFDRLVAVGADVHALDNEGQTVLHYAAKFDRVDEMLNLIEVGEDINAADAAGMTVFHAAARSEAWDAFETLSRQPKVDLNALTPDGKTPMMVALETNSLPSDIVEKLINLGADVHAKDNQGQTALHYAAKFDKDYEASLLADFEVLIDVRDCKGQTPLFLAAREGNYEICRELLVEYSANEGIPDNTGKLPRDVAGEGGHEKVVQLLNRYIRAGKAQDSSSGYQNRSSACN